MRIAFVLSFRSLVAACLLILLHSVQILHAQKCELADPYRTPKAATTGQTKVLIVFVKFADDRDLGDICIEQRQWPLFDDPTRLPFYANDLISPTPKPKAGDFGITHYFDKMSNGKFKLFGDVYPKVVTSELPRSAYLRIAKSGYGFLAQEILRKIDRDVDFAQFDTNPCDGIMDQVVFIIRRDPSASFTGVASLNGADAVYGNPKERIVLDGVTFDWESSGSFLIHSRPGNILPPVYMTRLLAHEYGHHLWNENGHFRGHLQPIRNNDTPANGTDRLGYVLMAGRGGGRDTRGDYLISSHERDLLGWINPIQADTSRISNYRLGDYYSTSDVIKVPLGNDRAGEYFLYLDNRQRVGPYDQELVYESSQCPSKYELEYLRTTGVLASLVHRSSRQSRIDILASDNELELSNTNSDYDGDLYGRKGQRQLTPFTKPALQPPTGKRSWLAIDRIYESSGSGISFDIVPDFRQRPIIREDSWLTESLDFLIFDRPLLLTNKAVFHIENEGFQSTAILIDPSSVLEISKSATVKTHDFILESGSTLILNGALDVSGYWVAEPGATIQIKNGASLQIGERSIEFQMDQILKGPIEF